MKSKRKAAAIGELMQQIDLAMRDQLDVRTDLLPEYVFHPTRHWRLDLAVPSRKIAVELEGGLFKGHRQKDTLRALAAAGARLRPSDVKDLMASGGRHNAASGMREDMVKYNEAAGLGWIVLRVMPEMITDGRALTWFERVWHSRAPATAAPAQPPRQSRR